VATTRCSASQRPIRGGTTYATSRTCGSGCYLILLAPSANRVYASEANRLVAAELQIMLGANDQPAIEPMTRAGIGYLALATENLDERACQALGRLSGCSVAAIESRFPAAPLPNWSSSVTGHSSTRAG
jgi:hypothetical protein